MLYHRVIKTDFIETKGHEDLHYFFNFSGREEERLKLDISDMTKDQVLDLLKKYIAAFPSSRSTIGVICSGLNDYREYYNKGDEAIEPIATWMLIDGFIAPNHGSTYLFTERDLRELAKFLDPRQQYIVYALYEGLKGTGTYDFYFVETSDVDYNNKTISCGGKTIPITSEFIDVINRAKNYDLSASKVSYATSTIEGKNRYNNLVYKNVLTTDTMQAQQSQLRVTLFAIRKQLGLECFTQSNLLYSGFLNQVYKHGFLTDPKEITFNFLRDEKIRELLERYDMPCNAKTALSRRKNTLCEYLTLYPNKL